MKRNLCSLLTITAIITFTLISGCGEDLKAEQQTTASPTDTKIQSQTKTQTQEITTITKVKPAAPADAPRVQLINPIHDFGTIKPNSKNTCEYNFKNTGKSLLVVKRIKATCGCTVPKLEKKEYAPGETGTIKVTYRASTNEGPVAKHLYIYTNDPENDKAELTLKATIQLAISATPKKMELSLKTKNAGLKPITVTSKDDQEFSIKSIASAGNAITFVYDTEDKKKKYTLKPKADLDLLEANLNGTIVITTDHPDTKKITVSYTTKPLLNVSTGRINLFNVEPGQMQRKPLRITSNYNENFTITSIRSKNNYIKAVPTKKDNTSVAYSLEITAPDMDNVKKRYFTDTLSINFENNQPVKINCTGWYTFKK